MYKKDFSKFFKALKSNWEIYINFILCITFALLGFMKIADQGTILSLLLGTISLMSVILLKDRNTNKEIQDQLNKIKTLNFSIGDFLKQNIDPTTLVADIYNSSKCYIFGLGHTILIPQLSDIVVHNPTSCPEINFLLSDPDGLCVKIAAFRAKKDEDELSEEFKSNLVKLEGLSSITDGKINYKVLDYLPPYNIFIFDPDKPGGKMLVHLASWRTSHTDRPYIELVKQQNMKWFAYFLNQFDSMWKSSIKPQL